MQTIPQILKSTEDKMKASIVHFQEELTKVRTGKANASLLDHIYVEYYGQPTPLQQVGSVSVPEPRMILIQAWDKTLLAAIEKAILASDLGITPSNDGSVIRLPFPMLTEERRKDIVKSIKKMAEDFKVSVRNHRRETNELLKKMQKSSEITEDDEKRTEEKVQELTDKYVKKVDEVAGKKEKEVLEV